ncbi:MAG: isochorismatase family cysteine hydrolase, partial [Oscillospiraceae bacterium]
IVVDMQNDFINGALGTSEAQNIVPKVYSKIEYCRQNGYKIMFTRDTHHENYINTQEGAKLPVEHCIKGTKGWQISEKLDVGDAILFDKISFGTLQIGEYFVNAKIQPREIQLVGLCTDICVISNAMILKAYFPEIKISVDAECCAGVTPQSHKNALSAMKMCQIDIINE